MEQPYIVGIGGANLDICGRCSQQPQLHDSNVGRIHLSTGGVCRNICENAVRMGCRAMLISAVGDDANGRILLDSCKACGLDISCVSTIKGARTGTYLSLHGPDGDMLTAVNDMEILSCLMPQLLERFAPVPEGAAAILIDANLPPETIQWICDTYGGRTPIFADAVSCVKAPRLRPVLDRLHTFKPNLMEAQLLTGGDSAEECARRLRELGVQNVCVSAGSRGVYYSGEGEAFWARPQPIKLAANATGAGDCLMGGLLAGFVAGMPLRERVRFAVTASVLTVQSADTIRKDLSKQLIFDSIEECMIV